MAIVPYENFKIPIWDLKDSFMFCAETDDVVIWATPFMPRTTKAGSEAQGLVHA